MEDVNSDMLTDMLKMQHSLQLRMKPAGRDPMMLEEEDRAQFIRDMTLALEDELHEALNETGWKPWATSRHLHNTAFTKELIDAWHFFMNLMLVAAAAEEMTIEEYAQWFYQRYREKNGINAQRQADGYDGLTSKCQICKRDILEAEISMCGAPQGCPLAGRKG